MPGVVPYSEVLTTMARRRCTPAYPNGGVFTPNLPVETLGLLTADDPTIRPGLPTRVLDDPTPRGLAAALLADWQGGELWLMPAHHWAYELQHGGKAWLGTALQRLDVTPADLEHETVAHALAFGPTEREGATTFFESLWTHLERSDFAATFPESPGVTLALLHHHGQLWWQREAVPDASG